LTIYDLASRLSGKVLKVLGEPPVSSEPGKAALDHIRATNEVPASGVMDLKLPQDLSVYH
jgi:hypothetical protein